MVHDGVMEDTRVLVVDDEPMVREVLARYLEKDGFDVDTAADGEAALDAFEAARPDLVLLDLMLPQIDGLEVFRRMRAHAPTAGHHAHRARVRRPIESSVSSSAPTTTSRSRSPRERSWRACAPCCAASAPADPAEPRTPHAGDLEIDVPRREVRRAGTPVKLTRKEFDLLAPPGVEPGRDLHAHRSCSKTSGTSRGTATRTP